MPVTAENRSQATIEATPEPITIDTARTVVIVVDMQNDFGSKGGMFDRAGIDIAPIQRAVAPISSVLESARYAGMKVIYLKMGFVRIFPISVLRIRLTAEARSPWLWATNACTGWNRRSNLDSRYLEHRDRKQT